MPLPKMNCKQCGREFYVLQAIQRVFCSPECRYLNNKGLPPISLDNADNAARIRAPEKGTQKVEEDARLAGQRAGRTFEAITKRALGRELETKSQQSVIISGSGANLSVRNDALQIKHGMSYAPQEVLAEEFNRAVHSLKRIVWCAATGNISFAALKWCHEQGIDVLMLDKDGTVIYESNPDKSANIHIKRAQHNISRERELEVARWLILGKVMEQYRTYNAIINPHNRVTTEAFTGGLHWLSSDSIPSRRDNLETIRLQEARVASAYFATWCDIPVNWADSDRDRIPEHWKIVGNRNSPLHSGNPGGKAVRPAQAILNHAYGVLEHAARVALLAVGLDISVGILHADKPGRDSLVYDLMELGRGTVDHLVLSFLRKTEFHKGDFTQVVTGEVKLHPELARAVVATCSIAPDALVQHATILRNLIAGDASNFDISAPPGDPSSAGYLR